MTLDEADAFYRNQIFAVLPGVQSWLQASHQPAATFTAWVEGLERCELRDANEVIQDIKFGLENAPESWNFGPRFVAMCRARSGKRAVAAASERTLREIGRPQPINVQKQVQGHVLWKEFWEPMMVAIDNGTMTRAEAFREWERILDVYFGKSERLQGVI